MKPTKSPIDITNQKLGVVGSAADPMRAFSAITVGTIPAIRRFIDSSSDTNVPVSARRYDPPAMSRMNSAWKIVQPKAKPRMYSTTTSASPARPKTLESTAPARMPTPSPATQCIVDPTPWRQRAASTLLQERPAHAGIRGQQHESPFEHRRFRRGADVHRHEQQGNCCQQKPQQHHAVQHRTLPGPRHTDCDLSGVGHILSKFLSRFFGSRLRVSRVGRHPVSGLHAFEVEKRRWWD